MGATNPAWKKFERYVAKKLGGHRRGPDYGSKDGGRDDVVHDAFAIECKLRKVVHWADSIDALDQARQSDRNGSKLPLAVLKRKSHRLSDAIVCIRLDDFASWYGDG